MNTVIGIVVAILLFGFMIFAHELAHFIAARLCKVTVLEFAIGMGPKLFQHTSKRSGTLYTIRLLPIGGFTSMLGENDDGEGDEHALSQRPCWQRLIILSAGSVMNILTAIVAMFILTASASAYYSTTVKGFYDKDAASLNAGLRSGDVIVSVNNNSVNVYSDIVYAVMREGTEPCDITVIRNGEKVLIKDIVFPTDEEEGITFGVVDFAAEIEYKSLGVVLKQAVFQSFSTLKLIYQSLFDLISGKYGMDSVSGPVGAVKEITEVASTMDFSTLIYMFVFISMNLGVTNLLPIPALDGGRIIFVLIEMIRRKPIKPEYEGYIHVAGMALLLIFMGAVTVFDILKIIN